LAVTIPLAFILRSPWALVYGAIASNIAGLIGSFIIQPYRPRFSFNLQKAKTLFKFGKWLTLSSWVNYISSRGDSIFIGRLLGVEGLGIYQMAHRISDIYSLEISVSIMNVLFPAYSKAQDNITKLREAFLLSMEIMASIVFPLGVTIYLLAPVFTPVIFGQQWIAAITPMGIFGIAAAFGCLLSLGKSLFYGLGRPSLSFYITIISTAVMFGLFWPLYKLFGLTGGAIAVLFGSISPFPLFIYQSMKHLEINVRQILGMALAPLVITLIIIIVSAFASRYISIQSDMVQLIVICIAVGSASIAAAYALWKWFKIGPFRVIALWK
jgi:O-antigen/teichoic acid export membrane protein